MTAYECITRAMRNRVPVCDIETAYSLIRTYKHKLWPDYSEQIAEMKELNESLSSYGFFDDNGRLKNYTVDQALRIIKESGCI